MRRKKLLATISAAALALLVSNQAMAATIYWTNWTSKTAGSPGSASGNITFPSQTVAVSYSGELFNAGDQGNWNQAIDTYILPGVVDNAPSPAGVSIQLNGGNNIHDVITFSTPVLNPILAIQSLGSSDTARYVFDQPFTLLHQGPGHWGGGTLQATGQTLTGLEGNGIIQFSGVYSSLGWTVPDGEFYHMFTVGAPASAPVPEPATMLLMGTGLAGLAAARRKKEA